MLGSDVDSCSQTRSLKSEEGREPFAHAMLASGHNQIQIKKLKDYAIYRDKTDWDARSVSLYSFISAFVLVVTSQLLIRR